MPIIKSIKLIRRVIQKAKAKKKTIGFVPTMGALHEGHCSLIRACKKENDLTILSIFVNPTQFAPTEDLAQYPRPFKKDLLLAKKENVDIIFHPSVEEMYPRGCREGLTCVEVKKISNTLCGKFRPGHFRGVATIVGKFLNIVEPDTMYLGQKDAQQAVVLKKMVADLNFPVKIKVCPIIRAENGLALSSRNAYLTEAQGKEAGILFKSLKEAKTKILAGEHDPRTIVALIKKRIQTRSSGKIQYVECISADSLAPLKKIEGESLIALAVFFGHTRLIDNIIVRIR